MAFKPIGPAKVYVGRFAAPAVTVQLVDVENVQIDFGIRMPWTSNADLDGTPTADGLFLHSPRPQIQMTLVDADIGQLTELLPLNATTAGSDTALGFGSSFTAIAEADVPSMFILPSQQSADGVNAKNGIWLPAVRIAGINGVQFGRTGDQEVQQAYNVDVLAAQRATDHAAAAIPEAAQIIFMGPPTAFGLTWTLS